MNIAKSSSRFSFGRKAAIVTNNIREFSDGWRGLFEDLEAMWAGKAPLGWDNTDHSPTAKAVCALLSDFFPATTGEIVHVDGGFHAVGV